MDIRKVKKVVELIQSSDVSEIEISNGEGSIRVVRGTSNQALENTPTQNVIPVSPPVSQVTNTKQDTEDEEFSHNYIVKSPMVGTYYESASPDQPPFVKVGDRVSVGDTLCIIEAMKIMNQITTEKSGKIVKIFVENAQPVEYDQVLFAIE